MLPQQTSFKLLKFGLCNKISKISLGRALPEKQSDRGDRVNIPSDRQLSRLKLVQYRHLRRYILIPLCLD